MAKKFSDLQISLRLRAFKNESTPEVLADSIISEFKEMADPVFPINGDPKFNRVQSVSKRNWLIRFLEKIVLEAFFLLEELKK